MRWMATRKVAQYIHQVIKTLVPWFDRIRPRVFRVQHRDVLEVDFREQSASIAFFIVVMVVTLSMLVTAPIIMVVVAIVAH